MPNYQPLLSPKQFPSEWKRAPGEVRPTKRYRIPADLEKLMAIAKIIDQHPNPQEALDKLEEYAQELLRNQ